MNYLWALFLLITCGVSAYYSNSINVGSHNRLLSNIMVFCAGLCNILIWMWVSKISKNIILDGLIYDIVLTVVFSVVLLYLNSSASLSILNYIGLGLALLGIILFKL